MYIKKDLACKIEFIGIDKESGCLVISVNDLTLEIYYTAIVCQDIDGFHWISVDLCKYNKKYES